MKINILLQVGMFHFNNHYCTVHLCNRFFFLIDYLDQVPSSMYLAYTFWPLNKV